MLTRIRIEGYKSFRRLDVRLKPLSVIIGPNASGKSNFVDALGLVGRIANAGRQGAFDKSRHRGSALQSVYGAQAPRGSRLQMVFQVSALPGAAALRRAEAISEAYQRAMGEEPPEPRVASYRLALSVAPETGEVRVDGDQGWVGPRRGDGSPSVEWRDPTDSWLLRHAVIEVASSLPGALHLDPDTVSELRQERRDALWHLALLAMDLTGAGLYRLLPDRLAAPAAVKGAGRLDGDGANLADFLYVNTDAFDEMNSWLKYLLPARPEVTIEGPTPDHYVSLAVHEYGMFLTGDLVSDGTWRVMGLIAALSRHSDTTLVAIEEPENGIHPSRYGFIRELAEEAVAAGKQVIFTTHSPLFAEHFDLDSIYAAYHPDPRKPDAVITPLSGHPVGRKLKKKEQLVAAAVMDPGEGLALGDYMAMGELE